MTGLIGTVEQMTVVFSQVVGIAPCFGELFIGPQFRRVRIALTQTNVSTSTCTRSQTVWKPVADNSGFRFALIHSPRWTNETEEFVRTEVLGELDEPLGHELLREAAANRSNNLRSSLILAVAAAEVGFKQFASRTFPDTEWILELPSPPLEKMLEHFPWSKLGVQICGKVPSIPIQIVRELKKAVNLRNQIVHAGAPKGVAKLKGETVDSVLSADSPPNRSPVLL